jgi:hypothetical protein
MVCAVPRLPLATLSGRFTCALFTAQDEKQESKKGKKEEIKKTKIIVFLIWGSIILCILSLHL